MKPKEAIARPAGPPSRVVYSGLYFVFVYIHAILYYIPERTVSEASFLTNAADRYIQVVEGIQYFVLK